MHKKKVIGYKWHDWVFHKSNKLYHCEKKYYDNFYMNVVSSLFMGTFYFFFIPWRELLKVILRKWVWPARRNPSLPAAPSNYPDRLSPHHGLPSVPALDAWGAGARCASAGEEGWDGCAPQDSRSALDRNPHTLVLQWALRGSFLKKQKVNFGQLCGRPSAGDHRTVTEFYIWASSLTKKSHSC